VLRIAQRQGENEGGGNLECGKKPYYQKIPASKPNCRGVNCRKIRRKICFKFMIFFYNLTMPASLRKKYDETMTSTDGAPRRARIRSQAIFPYGLHVTKLVQAEMRQLTAKSAFLHTAERHAGIAGAVAVNKDAAALQAGGKILCQRHIGGKHRRRQTEIAVIGQLSACAASRATVMAATGPNIS
jgi:hypothetical protein